MLKTIALMVAMTSVETVEPPTDAQVLRAMPRAPRGIPYLFEECRDNITIVKRPVGQVTVAMTFCPLREPKQVRITKWACEVHYAETMHVSFPFNVSMTKKRVQLVYIDKAELVR
ncbi:MAG: hypothetical protein L0241_09395 [Planctomycetia bacterium]|nr:hypothetical protein [Planctomycetia bacterium]